MATTPSDEKQLSAKAIAFINALKTYDYCNEMDKTWNVIFQINTKWYYLSVSEYQKVYFVFNLIDGQSIEIEPARQRVTQDNLIQQFSLSNKIPVSKWEIIFEAGLKWLDIVKKNWVKANKFVFEQFPLRYRKGTIPSCIVGAFYPEYTKLQKELGVLNCKAMLKIIDNELLKNDKQFIVEKLTANAFFHYCKLAYKALVLDIKNKTAKELYVTFSDGRHEGLLDIDPDSEKEFADWIDGRHPKRTTGGHPWEIMRGGNTSNIQLNVSRPNFSVKKGFKIEIFATGVSRLAESIKMFLEIHKNGKPIFIANPDSIREQILRQDNFGISPEYASLHRANQQFQRADKVNNVLYFNDLKGDKKRLMSFINWEPLPILRNSLFKS